MSSRRVITLTDASGARLAAEQNMVVIVVDVIDMSTTLEGALEAGALTVLGASPDISRAPVFLSPESVGEYAARIALLHQTDLVVISEPRVGGDDVRRQKCSRLIQGINAGGGNIAAVLPNLGAETPRLCDLKGKVVVAATDTGGVAYDAAFQVDPELVTVGTIARTLGQKGNEPALSGAYRALKIYKEKKAAGIAVVAASRNSLEDVLASQYIANLLLYLDDQP